MVFHDKSKPGNDMKVIYTSLYTQLIYILNGNVFYFPYTIHIPWQ